MNDALDVRNVSVSFGGRVVLRDISLSLAAGESVAMIAPSGAGKTTLLNCIIGTLRPNAGTVRVEGVDVAGLSPRDLARLRAERLGIVFQHGELLGELSPVENVSLPAFIAGRPRDSTIARATAILDQLGVPAERETTHQLSGGERQRTALARALINEPAIVLADEPTGSLDPETRDSVAELLFSAPRRWNCGLLVVTHDREVSRRADRTVSLSSAMGSTK